ncbi:hypothetical protein [Mesoplasma chauliocola]|nr:hypothetical protein [Mesoplasma chauliocola]
MKTLKRKQGSGGTSSKPLRDDSDIHQLLINSMTNNLKKLLNYE